MRPVAGGGRGPVVRILVSLLLTAFHNGFILSFGCVSSHFWPLFILKEARKDL